MQKADGMLIRVQFSAGSADQRQNEIDFEFTATPTFICGIPWLF